MVENRDLTPRTATPADVDALRHLASRMANFELPPWRTAAEVCEADANAMVNAVTAGDPDSQVFIVERGGRVAGCLHMLVAQDFFGRRHAHISVVAVSEEAEGTGVGMALMDLADQWARRRRLPLITLNVFAANARARRLYEKAGFTAEVIKYAKPVT